MQPVRELLLREEPTSYPDPAREGPSNQGHLQFIATHGKGLLTLLVFLMHMPPPFPLSPCDHGWPLLSFSSLSFL